MTDRTCGKCGKVFQLPCLLKRHHARKTPCDPIVDASSEIKNKCRYCGRSFATAVSMYRHVRQSCKIANSDDGMEQLMEHTLQRQLLDQKHATDALRTQMEAQSAAVAELTTLLRGQLAMTTNVVQHIGGPAIVNNGTVTNVTNITQINIRTFDGKGGIVVPIELVRAAFTENPRLIEYCKMSDEERTDVDKAAPFVLEALVDLVRRAHRDPISRNVYLNPKRADQAMIWAPKDDDEVSRWEVRELLDVVRNLFTGVADNLHDLTLSDQKRAQLPFDVQCAASCVPNMYGDEPDRFVRDGKASMVAHLINLRPASTK